MQLRLALRQTWLLFACDKCYETVSWNIFCI